MAVDYLYVDYLYKVTALRTGPRHVVQSPWPAPHRKPGLRRSRHLDAIAVTPRPQAAPGRRLAERVQTVPLFYRVLLGNCFVVVLGAGMGTYLTTQFSRIEPHSSPLPLVITFMVLGTALSLLVNYL